MHGREGVAKDHEVAGDTAASKRRGRLMTGRECRNCNGTGRCPQCHGTGKFPYPTGTRPCSFCDWGKGNGACRVCHGTGVVA